MFYTSHLVQHFIHHLMAFSDTQGNTDLPRYSDKVSAFRLRTPVSQLPGVCLVEPRSCWLLTHKKGGISRISKHQNLGKLPGFFLTMTKRVASQSSHYWNLVIQQRAPLLGFFPWSPARKRPMNPFVRTCTTIIKCQSFFWENILPPQDHPLYSIDVLQK